MAELHVVGAILGASGFPSSSLCCKWNFVAGSDWGIVEGSEPGQTHVDVPAEDPRLTVWEHPLGPKLSFQVLCQDGLGRNELCHFLQSPPALVDPTLAHRPSDRFRLRTQTMGTIIVEVSVVARGFSEYGVVFGGDKLDHT
ncbi:hypothetical protein M427DRAFT_133683 [Gonapodya prolifera JEL478]|uniref:B9 domain-containing protein 2 n=1 Tax=Gonapodya prolifera (strain JEL478) TaxID=1344416 RepID=A0A139AKD9_GONPJ|nr:hypothetical protein M427DRAFT_133683 [Gonapodya prolifera JEL478]|eukprot:KXS17252.1 hypothetical protein M427DRAFT_133683 [Gonapodya prolifera JEL478]